MKAALLYADHTHLISPGSDLFTYYLAPDDTGPETALIGLMLMGHRLAWLRGRYENYSDGLVSLLHRLFAGEVGIQEVAGSPEGRELLRLAQDVRENIESPAMEEIRKAWESGLLAIHKFHESEHHLDLFGELHYWLHRALFGGEVFPILDEATVTGYALASLRLPPQNIPESGTHVQLAADLFLRLPLFDTLPIGEVIDIRKELARPLVHFRASLIQYANEIKGASWSLEFEHEVQHLCLAKIQPAVLEIEDSVRSNKLLLKVLSNISTMEIGSGTLVAYLLNQASFSSRTAALTGALAAGTMATVKAVQDWQKERTQQRQNGLFFYYALQQRVSSGGG